MKAEPKIIFLGTSGGIQVPSFHCECSVCNEARLNPRLKRTHASLALLGHETTIIDATPDLAFQLERESIRKVNNIFITHWHSDHVWGLADLCEPASHEPWPPINLYVPQEVAFHFDEDWSYMKSCFNVHPIKSGDKIDLPDASWEAVKTIHTPHSIGFIVKSKKTFAYLGDGAFPPDETFESLEKANLDFIILESTMDELDEQWNLLTVHQATELWKKIGTKECYLTHLSCHGWKNNKLIPGLPHSARMEYEKKNGGLVFAYDGLAITL